MAELTFKVYELSSMKRQLKTETLLPEESKLAVSEEPACETEGNGFLHWKGRFSSVSPNALQRETFRRNRSKSLIQLNGRAQVQSRDAVNANQRTFTPPPFRMGRESNSAMTSSTNSSCERLPGSTPSPAWDKDITGSSKITKGKKKDETGKIDRKISFSSILNRNSESYKQSRFRRASSFSFVPKDSVGALKEEALPFESRIRIPNRRRPLSLNSYEYQRLNSTSYLPSPSEEMEGLQSNKTLHTSKLDIVVKKAAAWLEESKSMLQNQCVSVATGNARGIKEETLCAEIDGNSEVQNTTLDQTIPSTQRKDTVGLQVQTDQFTAEVKEANKNDILGERFPYAQKGLDFRTDHGCASAEDITKTNSQIVESSSPSKDENFVSKLDEKANLEDEDDHHCKRTGNSSSSEFSFSSGEDCFQGDIWMEDVLYPRDTSEAIEKDDNMSRVERADDDLSYLPAIRALLRDLERKNRSCNPDTKLSTSLADGRQHAVQENDVDVQCNRVNGEESPRLLNPRRHGTCKNPFQQLVLQGSIDSERSLNEPDCHITSLNTNGDHVSVTEDRVNDNSCLEKQSNSNVATSLGVPDSNKSCSINRVEEMHEPKEIRLKDSSKTNSESKQAAGFERGLRKCVDDSMASSPQSNMLSEQSLRNSCGFSMNSNNENILGPEQFENEDRMTKCNLQSSRSQSRRCRPSRSKSDIGVRVTEIQYLPSLKRNRRRRPASTSSSLKLEWNSNMHLHEVDVDSYNECAKSACLDDRMEDKMISVESDNLRKVEITKETELQIKEKFDPLRLPLSKDLSGNFCPTDDEIGVNISNESDLPNTIFPNTEKTTSVSSNVREERLMSATRDTSKCVLDPDQSSVLCTEDANGPNGTRISIDSLSVLSHSSIPEKCSNSCESQDILSQWQETGSAVEAMLNNKTDDWKTANFHKIHASTDEDSELGRNNKSEVVKEEGPVVFVNQEDLGSPWFKNRKKRGKNSKEKHSNSKETEKSLDQNGSFPNTQNGLDFLRGKFQKFAKWSKRAADLDSDKQKRKEKDARGQNKKATKRKVLPASKGNSSNIMGTTANNVSLYDVNRNFVLSSEFIKKSKARRMKRGGSCDEKESRASKHLACDIHSAKLVADQHGKGFMKDLQNPLNESRPIKSSVSRRLSIDEEASLTTVSTLSTKLPEVHESFRGSTISLSSSDSSNDTDDSDSTLSGPMIYTSDSSSSGTINESIDRSEMPDFRSPSRIQDDLAVLLERKMTRKKQGLQEIDFHPLIPTTKGKVLVSRDWLYERVHRFLLRKNSSKYNERLLLISGGHGSGKTTFLKSIVWSDSIRRSKNGIRVKISNAVLSYHFCSKADSNTTSVAKFVLNMAVCLVENGELAAYTRVLSEDGHICGHLNAEAVEKAPEMAFLEGIIKPLNEIYGSNSGPACRSSAVKAVSNQLLILVDAVDHQCTDCKPAECITALLANNFHLLPSWISLVLAGTRESLNAFSSSCADEICLDNVANWDIQSDIYSFTEMELPILSSEGISKAKIHRLLDNVVRFSKGSFHVAHMAVQYLSSSFASAIHQPSLQSLDNVKLVSYLFKMKFGAVERNRILALSLLDILFVSQELPKMSSLYKVVESSCSSQRVSFQDYKMCLEKLLELQMISESTEGKLFLCNITRKWLESSDSLKAGFSPTKGHNLLSVYYMKTLTSNEGRYLYLLANHLASSSFGEDIKDSESRVSFLAWTLTQVFKSSSAGFMEPCNVFRPQTDVYHLFLHTELDFKAFKRKYRTHPIVIATSLQQTEIVSLLLDHKHYDDKYIQEALQEAARVGNIPIFEFLLERKGEISILKCKGKDTDKTCFDIALENHNLLAAMRILQIVWQEEEDVQLKTELSHRTLCEACQVGNMGVIDNLLQNGFVTDVNATDKTGNSPLVSAASRNQLIIAKYLVENGADVDAFDGQGMSPLLSSVMNGHVEISEWLISQDARVDAEDRDGKTPLIHAAANDLSGLIHSLFMEGATLNHLDKNGLCALSVACQNGLSDLVKTLLKNRAITETVDKQRKTPLHYACESGNLKTIQLLLDNGANIGHKDIKGYKPLEVALLKSKLDVVALLLKYGAHVGKSARSIAERDIGSFLCLICHLEQRGNIMIKAGKFTEANEDFQRAMNMIETSRYRSNKEVLRIKLLCQQDSRKKFI